MKKMLPALAAFTLFSMLSTAFAQMPPYPANNPGFIPFMDDAGTGVSSEKTYTHAVNLGENASHMLNGVLFVPSNINSGTSGSGNGAGDRLGYNWSGFPGGGWGGNFNGVPNGNVVSNLLHFTGSGDGTWRLSGLREGAFYELSLFFRNWGDSRPRTLVFMPGTDQAKTVLYNQTDLGATPHLLVFHYKADSQGGLTITSSGTGNAICLFAFMNEQINCIQLYPATDITTSEATLHAEMAFPEIPDEVAVFWGFEDGVWEGSSNLTVMAAHQSFDVGITGLEASTNYFYRFMAVDGVVTNWSGLGTFATRGNLADIAMLQAADGVAFAFGDVRLDWAGKNCDAADILLLYGENDWEDDVDDWLDDPGALSFFQGDCATGDYSFMLSLPNSTASYFCRAFAINEFGTNAAPSGVSFTSLLTRTSGLTPKHWVWIGTNSVNWADLGNWGDPVTFAPPNSEGQLQGQNLLIGVGRVPFLPLNQNISGLSVNELQIALPVESFEVRGEAFTLLSRFNCLGGLGGSFDVSFHTPIEVVGNTSWSVPETSLRLRLYGALSEPQGVPRAFTSNGNIHFHGPVGFSGGLNGTVNYHHPEATGGIANPPNPHFYFGTHCFNLPAGTTAYEYDLPFENAVRGGASFFVRRGVAVFVHTPVTSFAADDVHMNNDAGTLVFTAPAHTFTGGIFLYSGLVVFKGEILPGGRIFTYYGSMDLDGHDLPGRILGTYIGQGANYDGLYRNQNPEKRSHINGETPELGNNNFIQFGGVGDILYTGNFTDTNTGRRFFKAGPGTLTLTGETLSPDAASGVMGGTMILDYETNNNPKLAPAGPLRIDGNLILRGNASEHTVQSVGTITIGYGDEQHYNRSRISPEGRGGKSATFRFTNLTPFGDGTYFLAPSLDFAPGKDGHIRTSQAKNNAAIGALSARITFNGESFARVSDTDEVDGYFAIEPLPAAAYSNSLAEAAWSTFVDLAGNTTNPPALATVGALRFNDPNPATLTLEGGLRLSGEEPFYRAGAVLVTPRVGANEVVIDGPGIFCDQMGNGSVTLHQYNTNAALTINAQVFFTDGTCVVKTGPGKLVLTHPNSQFTRLFVNEGTLEFHSIRNNNESSSLGRMDNGHRKNIVLGDATLRYVGGGNFTDRQFQVRGFGVLEASGSGPLVFTHDFPVLVSSTYFSGNQLLTLAGETEGEIWGSLNNLQGGRLRKRGTGTWTLTETSHSPNIVWGAEIFEGALVLDGTLGWDVTVHSNGVLKGSGRVHRDLIVKDGGILEADPEAPKLMEVGKNLVLESGAKILLPKKLSTGWKPVLKVNGNITGEFEKPNHAYVDYNHAAGLVSVRYRPTGTLLMVR